MIGRKEILLVNESCETSEDAVALTIKELTTAFPDGKINHCCGSVSSLNKELSTMSQDLILVNLDGGQNNKRTLLNHVVQYSPVSNCPVVTFNGSGSVEEMAECQRLGVRGYVQGCLSYEVIAVLFRATRYMQFCSIIASLCEGFCHYQGRHVSGWKH